jgi:chemotaxis protein methyltransferase CheR
MSSAAAARVEVHEQSLAFDDFDRLAGFVYQLIGIKLPRNKHAMVEGRLRRRLAATGASNFAAYCQQLFEAGEAGPETEHLINALTTNKTDFFREPDHFRILTDTVLPDLCARGDRLKLWSSACSTGAEPYTLAMVVDHFLQSRRATLGGLPPPFILATDISGEVLAAAKLGIYPEEMIAPVPPEWRRRYLLRARNRASGKVRIAPALRTMVHFGKLNLMASEYPADRDFDVIFCRNVLIYFDRAGQAAVLHRLCAHLRPGGALVLGHSETINGFDLPVQPIGHTIFRRT